jgi:hypothetical protein
MNSIKNAKNLVLLPFFIGVALAQTTPNMPTTPVTPVTPATALLAPWNCDQEPFRRFDFWLGTWQMQDRRSGTILGQAMVRRIHGQCAIREDWQAVGGGSGANIVSYHPPLQAWRMVSVIAGGGHLLSIGSWQDNTLSFLTDIHSPNGLLERRRISWSKTNDPKRVLQVWEVSSDDGKTWRKEFDGVCLRLTP